MPFISFSSLIALARTFDTRWNKRGESGHTCPLPHFREITSSFSSLRMMLAVGLSYMAFIMLRYVPSVPASLSFYRKWVFC